MHGHSYRWSLRTGRLVYRPHGVKRRFQSYSCRGKFFLASKPLNIRVYRYTRCGHRCAEVAFEDCHFWLREHEWLTPHIVKMLLLLHWVRHFQSFVERNGDLPTHAIPALRNYWDMTVSIRSILQSTQLARGAAVPSSVVWGVRYVLDAPANKCTGYTYHRLLERLEARRHEATELRAHTLRRLADVCHRLPIVLCGIVADYVVFVPV